MDFDDNIAQPPLAGGMGMERSLVDAEPTAADMYPGVNYNIRLPRGLSDQGGNLTAMIVLQPSTNILVPIIMFSIGLVGNIVAVGIYHCSASWHRGSAFYGILRGFFITSIIGYLSVYPVIIAVHVNGLHWIGGKQMCDFHGFAVLTFGIAMAFMTGLLGFERFLAGCRPVTYNRKVEPRKVPFVLVLLWIVSVFTGILPLVGFGRISMQYPSTWCFVDWRNEETVGRLFGSVLATIIVAVMLLVIVSIIAATVGASIRTAKKCRGMVAGKENERGGGGRYSLALTLDDNSHRIPRRFYAADRALMWATIHYDLLAIGFLIFYIPVIVRLIVNVSALESKVNNFKNLSAMHWAELYPAFCPWLYVLCHEQIWMRLTCRKPLYRDVPYTRTRSTRRRNSTRRRSSTAVPAVRGGNDCAREANAVSGRHRGSTVSIGSNHVNVIMHEHIDGYAVGNRREADGEEDPNFHRRSIRKRLDFIKEDDANNRSSIPHSPSSATTTSSPVSPTTNEPPSDSALTPISGTMSPTPSVTHPLLATSTPKAKLTATTSVPTSNGPIIHNHVGDNGRVNKTSNDNGRMRRKSDAPPDGGSPARKGEYTRIPMTEPVDLMDNSVPLVDVMSRRSAFARAGRKESSI